MVFLLGKASCVSFFCFQRRGKKGQTEEQGGEERERERESESHKQRNRR